MNPDELTPDDLFRPEPHQIYQQSEPQHQVYTPIPVDDLPEPGEPWPQQPPDLPPRRVTRGQAPGGDHAMPQQGQPWGRPEPMAQSPGNHQLSANQPPAAQPPAVPYGERQPFTAPTPYGAQPQEPLGASDETQLIAPHHHQPPAEPGLEGAGGDADETRHIPQIPQSFPQVPPRPNEPPRMPPQEPDPQTALSPFAIRPGLPGGAYGEEPSYATARPEPEAGQGPVSDEGATQLLPPVANASYAPQAPAPQASGSGRGRRRAGAAVSSASAPQAAGYPQPTPDPSPRPRSRRAAPSLPFAGRMSPAGLAAIVVAGCALVGLIAGAALSDSGEEKPKQDSPPQKAAATSSAPEKAPADPAEEQAKALDNLLKDSNSSRSAVINAVEQIKNCNNLGGAAESLRDAAAQRNDLVSRLAELSVDRLANHRQLTTSLNKAWASSASADNHYASWADDVAGHKKRCKKGQARGTRHAQLGNRASGEATVAKQRAAGLWNTVAREYGLTQRKATDL